MTKVETNIKNLVLYVVFCIAWTIAVIVLAQIVTSYVMAFFLGEALTQPHWTAIYEAIVYGLSLVLIMLVPAKIWKNSFKLSSEELGVNKWPTFTDIGLAPAGYIVHMFLATGLLTLFSQFEWFDAGQAQDIGFNYFIHGTDKIIAMIATVFLAPIAEEMIIRGWLFGKLRSKLNFIVTTILVSLTFAVLHFQWNVGVTVFSLSLVLCTLREVTGSVWSGMLLHMLSNGIAFYLLYNMV